MLDNLTCQYLRLAVGVDCAWIDSLSGLNRSRYVETDRIGLHNYNAILEVIYPTKL